MQEWLAILSALCLCLLFYCIKLRKIRLNLILENKKVLSQKKSSEVITGQIAEKLAPFLSDFEHNPQNAIFLGQPIDYLVFDEEEVVFVEIKSGNAKLTAKQRKIKKLIEDNKVTWKEIRIK